MSTTRYSFLSIVPVLALFLLLLSTEPSAAQSPGPFFYYYEGSRVSLQLDPTRIAVRFKSGVGLDARRSVTAAAGDLESYDRGKDTGALDVAFISVRSGHDPLAAIASLKSRREVQSAGPVYQFRDGGRYGETDEFIVKFKTTVTPAAIDALNRANGVELLRPQAYSPGVLILRVQPGNKAGTLSLANKYFESGLVEFAEPNFVILEPRPRPAAPAASLAPATFPNDPFWPLQWALNPQTTLSGPKQGTDIRALTAWASTQGSAQVTIAIIDEGVDRNNPDLSGRLVLGIDVTVVPTNTVAAPNANDYHGTASAGIAAATGNNGTGIAGVCWQCKIMPVKVAFENSDGSWVTTPAQLASGINWAYLNGADVLSNSWTMSGPSDDVKYAILNAWSGGRMIGGEPHGATIVFAAGNQDAYGVSFPANMGKYVIGVGATNWCDQRKTETSDACNGFDSAWGSNYGPYLDLVAPGEAIVTTCNGNRCNTTNLSPKYTWFYGTSASTPMVAGVAGLLYSLNYNLYASDVRIALRNGAKSLPPTWPDTGTGYKRLDAAGAISALYDLSLSVEGGPGMARPGDLITYTLHYTNTGLTTVTSPVLTVTIPSILDYVGSNPSFSFQNDSYTLHPGQLAPGASGSATFTVRVAAGTEGQARISTFQIGSPNPELDMTDNVATDRLAVIKYDVLLPMIQR